MAVKNPKIIPYVQYVQELSKRFRKIEFRQTPRIQNELDDALVTIASIINHADTDYINPLDIELKEHPVHCSHVEAEQEGLCWYSDIKNIWGLVFIQKLLHLSGEVLYSITPYLGLP